MLPYLAVVLLRRTRKLEWIPFRLAFSSWLRGDLIINTASSEGLLPSKKVVLY